MTEPRRIWWARRRKLCALERPGGGGRSHRRARREDEIEYLMEAGVRTVVSCMATRHNLALAEEHWIPVEESLAAAIAAGLTLTPEAAALAEASPDWIEEALCDPLSARLGRAARPR